MLITLILFIIETLCFMLNRKNIILILILIEMMLLSIAYLLILSYKPMLFNEITTKNLGWSESYHDWINTILF